MRIELDHEKLRYSGRIDDRNPKRPEFIFPASYLAFRFQGTAAWVTVENRRGCWDNYLGIILDGKQWKVKLPDEGKIRVCLGENLADVPHEVMVFKRQDACHEYALTGLELSEESRLLEPPERPARRIEVFGDSVSAGEVSEAVDYVGKPDPEHSGEFSNSWYSYSWIAARRLGAELHDTAQGGIALMDGTGWFCDPVFPGMESCWDKVHYNPALGPATDWDFKRYRPHVVVAAIGQNDSHPEDYMKEDPEGKKAKRWKAVYRQWIEALRKTYPRAAIVLTTTILCHDPSWDKAIHQVWEELGDERIYHFLYSENGSGTPGHIRIPEAERMAEELSRFIESLPEEIWQDEPEENEKERSAYERKMAV